MAWRTPSRTPSITGWDLRKDKTLEDEANDEEEAAENSAPLPFVISSPTVVLGISAGYSHTLAWTDLEGLFGWGISSWGRLGLPGGEYYSAPRRIQVKAAGESRIISAACGHYHSLLTTEDGALLAAGRGCDGQLGIGCCKMRETFTLVEHGALRDSRVISVAAGDVHSVALLDSGIVAAWGWEADGRLGRGDVAFDFEYGTTYEFNPYEAEPMHDEAFAVPMQVKFDGNGTQAKFKAVSAGGSHSLALACDGSVWSWGGNNHGQLGSGDNEARGIAQRLSGFGPGAAEVAEQISAGFQSSIVCTRAGRLFGMGNGTDGRLGTGDWESVNTPTQLQVKDLLKTAGRDGANEEHVVFATAGRHHSLAVTSSGQLFATGTNTFCQLGNGDDGKRKESARFVPLRGRGARLVAEDGCSFVDAGSEFTACVTARGGLWTCGRMTEGQIGHGPPGDKQTMLPLLKEVSGPHSELLTQSFVYHTEQES